MVGFEARFRLHTAVSVLSDFFIGLGQPGLAVVTGTYTTSDAMQTNIDVIGGGWIQSAKSVLVGQYQLGTAGAATSTTLTGVPAATLVADTFVKFGFLWLPNPSPSKGNAGVVYGNVTYFINGIPIPGSTTAITDANLPKARYLTPFVNIKTDHTTHAAVTLDLDWMCCMAKPTPGK